ncbi:cellulase family glycosylhydrolase [Microcella daejeonensis]|uniref:cellulase n=1 Tax=Microcella daejeonensis TaxID=2994971 RepID=A0A9E8MM35_9MICO|nr:cellulase family glycosylhydrolase [Microcella daejeonensis]WAB82149.1 cellulase family glycosylhydrolase [Microcella daejeonensis]
MTTRIRRTRAARRRRMIAITAVALVAVMIAGVAAALVASGRPAPAPTAAPVEETPVPEPTALPEADALEGVGLDALQQRRIDELRTWAAWLEANGAEGYVGELGWADSPEWEQLADYWYRIAEQEELWTSLWAAGSHWGDSYPLTAYGASGGSDQLDVALPQAELLEAQDGGDQRHGVNLAGLEFSTEQGFSAAVPGVLGRDFFDEPEASFAYLADRGIDFVRLPFRWERLQPQLGGSLDEQHAAIIDAMLDAAALHGVDIVLDVHNYGRYLTSAEELRLGTPELPASALSDVWLRISERWGEHPAVVAYGLMNEPHSLGDDLAAEALRWEGVTQEVLTALRDAGDGMLVLVPGYDWSSLPRWTTTHADGWITDPADNFRYEAHHYWDAVGEGAYALPYADELAAVQVSD